MKLIGEQTGDSLATLPDYEPMFEEGSKGELRLYVSQPLSDYDIAQIENDILARGATLTAPINQSAGLVSIKFEKRIAPLAIIAIAIGAVVLVGGTLLGWQIWKSTQAGVPLWVWLLGGAAVIYLVMSSETGKKATGLVIQAGKVYVAKGAAG